MGDYKVATTGPTCYQQGFKEGTMSRRWEREVFKVSMRDSRCV